MVGSERYVCNAIERIIAVQGRFRVIQGRYFGTNRKRIRNFLLVINTNLVLFCTVLEIRWFIGRKIVKFANFYPPQYHKSPSLRMTPFEFRDVLDISIN